ncbi:hypothetical protein L218DRAFT_976056 [Marasmius fiardii PR-910]|nr:hypothetical protein L218DRAFT_976056 [Marasmius fiardii PR-910]
MSAPSFPSFNSFPDLESGPSSSTGERDLKKKDKSQSKQRDKERKKRKHDHSLSPPAGDLYDARAQSDRDVSIRYFYPDIKGDPLNIQYGGPNRGDIPKYHVINNGRKILGLSPQWTVSSKSSLGIEVGMKQHKLPSLTDAKTRRILKASPRFLGAGSNSDRYREVNGFLRLPSNTKYASDYRSVEKDNGNDSDSNSESEHDQNPSLSDDEDSEPHRDTSHQITLKSLEQRVAANPSSISSWLALLARTLSTVDKDSKGATKARADISLSVLERAMSAHPRNALSTRLRLKYMWAGSEIWSGSKLTEEWERAVELGDADIWMEWLEWRISVGIDISEIFDCASRILAALDDSEANDILKVRLLWRVAVACQQAGFPERATALFEAEAEILFKVPQTLHGLPMKNVLDALEEFWESEVPRVGEIGSRGWAYWGSHGDENQSHPSTPSNVIDRADLDPYRQWGFSESLTDQNRRHPLRSIDDSDDPYSTILFSDLRQLLFSVQSDRAKHAFRFAWLSLLGLHVPGLAGYLATDDDSLDDRWCLTHLGTPSYLDAIFPPPNRQILTTDSVSGVIVGRQKEYANSFGPVKNWTWGSFNPLESVFGNHGLWDRVDVHDLDIGQIRRIFSQLRLGTEDITWDILALTFEAATDVKVASKLSRSFLENARDSLPHWGAHAQLERMRGRLNDARKVYQNVLVATSTSKRRLGESQLWWDWAEMEWQVGQIEGALSVVLKAARVEGRVGVAFLRAKRVLVEEAQNCETWKEVENWTMLGALLGLLTSNNVASCQQMFDERLEELRMGHVAHESMSIQALLFLYTHGIRLKSPMPPALLRNQVEKALVRYPSNSVILGIFLECEKGQGVWGRVRNLLGNSGEITKDVSRRAQEVWIARWEGRQWESELERTRASLAAAVEHERTRKSAVIWRLFIELEIRTNRLVQAKKLLFRGIGECPLSKELYLLAFVPLRSVFTGRELNGLAELMVERGIRMRRGLDEVVSDWKGEADIGKENEEEEDEIEFNSRELKRLKPY